MSLQITSLIIYFLLLVIPAIPFLFYPAAIALISKIRPALYRPKPDKLPSVTLIISAYNEESIIGARIENALASIYPRELLEIIVATDGSSDSTDSIVRRFAPQGVRLIQSKINRGKTAALRKAVAVAHGDILVFSDANSMYKRRAIWYLARWFANPRIGCVCGRLYYSPWGSVESSGELKYWNWDRRLKTWEGASGYLLGANGAIFALRREFAIPLPAGQSNDMVWPIVARWHGKKVVYDPLAVAVEPATATVRGEFRRKVRILLRGLDGVRWSLNYGRNIRETEATFIQRTILRLQIICKKGFRYLAIPSLILALVLGLFLPEPRINLLSILYLAVLIGAVFSTLLSRCIKSQLARVLDQSYLLMIMMASCLAFAKFLLGHRIAQWRSSR